jgi:GNAT superfamily N-acetyltransferase
MEVLREVLKRCLLERRQANVSSTSDPSMGEIHYRLMTAQDIGRVPMDCFGGNAAVSARIDDLGAAAILAFDGRQHVGQLQFRRHRPELRSKEGIRSPDYWGDFGGRGPTLPHATLGIFCFHVGQLLDGTDREARYQGRGIGAALCDYFLKWAEASGFAAVVAKHTPSPRPVMGYMGGQPADFYTNRGFELVSSWVDSELYDAVRERGLVRADADRESVARVGMCVKRFDMA